ncbi:phage tail tape measure protein [Pseudocitrobacter cyperus]|uniref:Phage tail tape measure protein n=1 Tax=Pseudocitrobacter cyperus TaxID=3112843 RepID=A0ABV0HJM6_9ENTR
MSNTSKLEVLLKAVDLATRPFKSVQAASQSLSENILTTQQTLHDLNGQASKIDGFRQSSAELVVTGLSLQQAKQQAAALAIQLKNTQAPTEGQTRAMMDARKNAADLQRQYDALRLSVQQQRLALSQAGINTRKLSADDLRLKNSISETTAHLGQQREALARVSAQQDKLNSVKRRYQAGKDIAGRVTAFGTAAANAGAAGARASVKLLSPGYVFAQKSAQLQATLGVAKDSEDMVGLRKQARQLGDASPVSAVGVISAQLSLARAGGSASTIQEVTPTLLAMSQVNNRSLDDNASALIALHKNPPLSGESVAHIAEADAVVRGTNAPVTVPVITAQADASQDTLSGDIKRFQSAYAAIGIDLFARQETSLRSLVTTATDLVVQLDSWLQKNQGVATTLSYIATVGPAVLGVVGNIAIAAGQTIGAINLIVTAASTAGALFTTVCSGIITAIGAITWPVLAIAAAVVAGALLIRTYWEPISAFFTGVVEGVMRAFAPIGEMFAPLAPLFAALGEKLNGVRQWFNELITPVQYTQEALNNCRDVGVLFGQSLADALLLPLNAFNKLRSGIDWVLQKLGIIDKASSTLDQTALKTNALMQSDSDAPQISQNGAYQRYQPVLTPAGRSYVDQSRSEFHITVSAESAAADSQLSNKIKSELEQWEQSRRTRQFSGLNYDLGGY